MLRGAIIGVGNVAIHGHLPGWLARGDVDIVAAADLRSEGRAALAQRLPGARWYNAAQEMLDSERPDFVDVCTPPASHAAEIRRALERGLHVLCEKPLVLSVEELDELASLAGRRGRVLATVHNWRHAPILARATELVRAGRIGEIRRCRWETLRDRPAAAAGTAANWRVDPAVAGGGILVDHGWHAFSVIQAWLAGEPHAIRARLETRRHLEWEIEDTAEVCLEYPASRAEVFLTWTASERANRVFLEGRKGTIAIDGRILEIGSASGETAQREEFDASLAEGSHHADWFAGVAEEFLEEIREPARRGKSLGEAGRCVRWMCAAQESSRRGGEPLPAAAATPARQGAAR
jgi:predicted dehydrogenase